MSLLQIFLIPATKTIAVKAQECFQKCQFERSGDSDCQRDCAKDYLPENGRGFAQGTPYGNNPQGGYNGQNYGQPYGKSSLKKKKDLSIMHLIDLFFFFFYFRSWPLAERTMGLWCQRKVSRAGSPCFGCCCCRYVGFVNIYQQKQFKHLQWVISHTL